MRREELESLVNAVADRVLGPTTGGSAMSAAHGAGLSFERRAAEIAHDPLGFASLFDHTNLKPEAQRSDILRLCEEALEYQFAAVCVHSIWVPLAHQVLRGSKVKVCSVAGFPSGAVPPGAKCAEAEIAVRNGAAEVDMVLPLGLLRQGEWDMVTQDIAAVARTVAGGGASLKVILETASLTEEETAISCALCRLAGAAFVKTSTGFHPAGGATAEAVSLMRQVVGDEMGVKASGGIRTLADALAMQAAGANRIGASASVSIVEALRKQMQNRS